MKIRLILAAVLIAALGTTAWLYLRPPVVGAVCLPGQDIGTLANGAAVVCTTGSWTTRP